MKSIGFILGICLLISSCETKSVGNSGNEKEIVYCSTNVALDETVEEWVEPVYDLSAIQFQTDFDGCMPQPNSTFINWLKTDSFNEHFPYGTDPIFAYLSTHIDSVSTTIVTESDSLWGPIAWQQYFAGGILFEDYQMPEKGGYSTLKTNCMNMTFVRSILFPIIENEENTWNEDSTSYGPDGAGCSYGFSIDSTMQTVTVDWYCGC